jgi:hypothetical protein
VARKGNDVAISSRASILRIDNGISGAPEAIAG